MKKINSFLVALIFTATLNSCIKDPESCFTVDKTTIAVGETITATNCSTDESFIFDLAEIEGFEMNEFNQARFVYVSDSIYTRTGIRSSYCSSDDPQSSFTINKAGKYYLVHESRNYRGKCNEEKGGTSIGINSYEEITVE